MLKTINAVIALMEEDYKLLESLSENNSAEEYIKKLIERELMTRRLENGYTEMAQINLELAQECFDADEQAARRYEEELQKNV